MANADVISSTTQPGDVIQLLTWCRRVLIATRTTSTKAKRKDKYMRGKRVDRTKEAKKENLNELIFLC